MDRTGNSFFNPLMVMAGTSRSAGKIVDQSYSVESSLVELGKLGIRVT